VDGAEFTHFYVFCLVSFIFYAFKFTGKLNQFDWTIYWGNVAAWLLQPALFLHFVLTFPEKARLCPQASLDHSGDLCSRGAAARNFTFSRSAC